MKISGAPLRRRISRSLATILFLSLVQGVVAPVIAPQYLTPDASAANSDIIQANLTLDANAVAGANDVTTSMTLGSVPPVHTNTGVGYYTFDGTLNKFAYAQRDFADRANISIFMWVYPTAAGVLLSHNGQVDPYDGYRLTTMAYTSGGKFQSGLYNSGAVFTTSTLNTPINNWYYVGLTYDGNTLRQYINGQLDGSVSMANWTTAASDFFHIGASQNGTCFGTCPTAAGSFRFGELSIYRSALSGTDVTANFTATRPRFAPSFTNPVNTTSFSNRNVTLSTGTCTATSGSACTYQWEQSINSGTSWSDISGATASTLVISQVQTSMSGYQYRVKVADSGASAPTSAVLTKTSSAATLTVTTPPGSETDTALDLNGINQYAWVADTGTGGVFDLATTLTLEAWVYPTETGSAMYIVATKVDSFQLFHIDGVWKYAFRPTATNFGLGLNTLVPVRINEWHHIAITRTGNSSSFYYDGQLAYTGTGDVAGANNLNDNSIPFVIGGKTYDGVTFSFPFKGSIDQVALYSVVRDAAGIDADMDSYISPSSTGLRAYYDFNEGSGSALYNRAQSATTNSDLAILGSPLWSDVKVVSNSSPYTTVKFPRTYINANGGWVVPSGVSQVSAFIVGGGGGGGWNSGGGGGGAGYLIQSNITVSGTVGVLIGPGGRGGRGPDLSGVPTHVPLDGSPTIFNGTSVAGGNKGSVFNTVTGGPSITTASGSSGAGGTGAATNGATGSAGGAGLTQTNFGDTLIYSAGGGGGGYNAAGGVGGGSTSSGAGNGGGSVTTTGTSGLGSRGGGGGASSARVDAGNGGSGVVIVKYLLASSKPIFSGPFNDTTTAGLVETFTVTGTPNSPLVRSYQWQVSTDTGTSWVSPTLGSGINSASYVTPVLTTSVSGNRYQYRVIVTDSDTVGLRMTETSSAVFLIINPTLQISGATTITKAINVAKSETFTITGGTQTMRYTLSPTISGITLDTSTANSPVIRVSESKSIGTFYETLTVTDSASATTFIAVTIDVIAPPSFSASSEQVINGTVLHIDAGSSASYAGTGNTVSDLSGRNLMTSLTYNFGVTSTNSAGTTRAATYLNNVTCVAPTYSTEANGSLSFNGTSSCAYISGVGYIQNYSFEVWFKRDGNQTQSSAILSTPYRVGSDQINMSLQWDGANGVVAAIFNGNVSGGWYSTTATVIQNLVWTHAMVTYNGTTLSLIINGETTTSVNPVATWNTALIDNGLLIGRKWDNSQTFKGSIGSIRIYDRVLTLSEIQQSYNATKGRYLGTINKRTQSKKYGVLLSDTYTVTSGANSISATFLPNNQSAIKWDTSTVRSTRLNLLETLTVGTYNETITVTDSLGQSVYLPLTFTVTKADTLTVSMDTSTVFTYNGNAITIFPKPVYKGLVGGDSLTVTTKFSSVSYPISATAPRNADTYTVIAADPVFTSGLASNYLNIIYETSTAVINKARQAALNPSMYGAMVGLPFTLSLLGGSGDGAVSETLTGVSTAPNCAISAHVLTSSTTQYLYCQVTFTKATSQNYLSESITVQIYFMIFVINQPSGQTGGGSTIGINGETSVIREIYQAPSITGVTTSGDLTYPLAITGAGFSANGAGLTTIKFWRNQILGASDFIIKSDTLIWAKQPAGATVGKVLVLNGNGTAVSEASFTPIVFTP